MIDAWFGRVLDAFEARRAFADTVVIVCTDHGHFLGEKDIFGKPGCPIYEPLGHIPLLIAWPGVDGGTSCDALTTNVDLHATLCDVFGVAPAHRSHGRSLAPLSRGDATSVREWALVGRVGARGALHHRSREVRARARRGERAAVDVVESLVDDAGTRARTAPAAPRRPRRPGSHARVRRCR